jgi:hypothetical protein
MAGELPYLDSLFIVTPCCCAYLWSQREICTISCLSTRIPESRPRCPPHVLIFIFSPRNTTVDVLRVTTAPLPCNENAVRISSRATKSKYPPFFFFFLRRCPLRDRSGPPLCPPSLSLLLLRSVGKGSALSARTLRLRPHSVPSPGGGIWKRCGRTDGAVDERLLFLRLRWYGTTAAL